ncbi:hypothetical protein BU23DRAFT_656926 [Bimuria novae-zelandiae CBS 107.79]|uniref:Ecp2 effector protein domain-containing protein n=1 Tax=Bimuria novae-zelandiae CBS 107.79 TaxID=1447943 RepID=A0A6A5UTK6_9PLEO|nr:hypothetical protein BU23DRAFT_656926 [Bimuria novae-zelandiae CBS 107.79]
MVSPSAPITALLCATLPLGPAAPAILPLLHADVNTTVPQLCLHPTAANYTISPNNATVYAVDTPLVRISITLPSEDAVMGSEQCRDAVGYLVKECVDGKGVWGERMWKGGVGFGVEKRGSLGYFGGGMGEINQWE